MYLKQLYDTIYKVYIRSFFIINNLKKRVVFLDRDGVINHDYGYVYEIDKFNFIDGVFEACKYFINLDYEIIIITNQSGINRGYYSEDDFQRITNWMIDKFNENGIKILKVYYCPHLEEENCNCRKPNPEMINKAVKEFDIDISSSWLIGDKMSDIQTAINSNISNYILITKEKSNFIKYANSLIETINIIK